MRKKEKEIDAFKAVYTIEAAKDFGYGNNTKIYIEINAKPNSDIQKHELLMNEKFFTDVFYTQIPQNR